MAYTISELAELSGVSTRTLRYYDEVNLLKPARYTEAGYRIYEVEQVDILQQILFYRELDMSIQQIQDILSNSNLEQIQALEHHYHELIQEQARLTQILKTMKKTIAYKKGKIDMQDQDKFEGFKEQLITQNEAQYGTEIREKYGHQMIDESNQKFRNMSQEDYAHFKQLESEIIDLLIKAKQDGNPESELAQELAAKHKAWLMYSWPSYSSEAHRGLAEMYVMDPNFKDYYDQHIIGGAQFLRDAIMVYTEKN